VSVPRPGQYWSHFIWKTGGTAQRWSKPYATWEGHSRTALRLVQVKLARLHRGGKVQGVFPEHPERATPGNEKLLLTKHRL